MRRLTNHGGMYPPPDALHDQHGRQVCICLALLQTEADLLPTVNQACNSLTPAQNGCQFDIRMPWILTTKKRNTKLETKARHESCDPTLTPDELTADNVTYRAWSTSIHTTSSARN